jgi:hypothetical protein
VKKDEGIKYLNPLKPKFLEIMFSGHFFTFQHTKIFHSKSVNVFVIYRRTKFVAGIVNEIIVARRNSERVSARCHLKVCLTV